MANVIVQTAYLGDLLLAVPLIHNLKKVEPTEPVFLVVRQGLGPFFTELQIADEVCEVKKGRRGSYNQLARLLNQRGLKYVFSPHQSVRSALFVRSLRADKKIGFKNFWTNWIYDEHPERPMALPDALRQLSLLACIDSTWQQRFVDLAKFNNTSQRTTITQWSAPIPDWASMSLKKIWSAKHFEEIFLADPTTNASGRKPSVLLAPGSVWNTKRWTFDGYAKLGKKIAEQGFLVELIGSPDEQKLCEEIARQIPGSVNWAGRLQLMETVKKMAAAKALFCNDSGAQHLAALVETPTLAVFGPTTLDLGYRPWSDRAQVVQIDLPCRPCGAHGSNKCPIGTHDCMKKISAEMVWAQAQRILMI